ncbi:TPA: tail fiber assembly protein [Salmonella enterica]|uniref:Tail fiber assembly protein n=6 Tax=Enterobacteriaceae TaxID=543 RepID=A0A3V2Y6V1_SALNE|nr:tail fiber assembly protein [Salmonella enterica]EAA3277319.1 tail fiber assembly protein [Salmonella enterica subsp. enterica serovar Brunei]EAA7384099.1 tail fiber assembly protein [Salmonella enterica subsp. enterica]EAA7396261.1 tail fiber assembly protein [Salmonella enterica subsp. enterica serovar Newport]EAA7876604.1 tail fiber assembly protein [Salmonella enterica subsp. enterica serovar Lexington]EBF8288233.1 tail fiber assembly protein [Salmonella enterica subsp. houtenae]EBG804
MVYRTRGNGIMKKYQNIKNFRLIDAPVKRDKTQAEINIGAYFLKSDDGQDWYECQSLFSDDTAKIMYDHEGVIWGVVNKPVPQRGNTYSVSMLWPVNMSVAEIDAADCPDDCRGDGTWLYQDGKVVQRVYSPEELRKKAEAEKIRRLSEAESAIAPLARAVKLNIATDEEIKRLEAWELYSVMVNRVDTASPDWPEVPDVA